MMKKNQSSSPSEGRGRLWLRLAIIGLAAGALIGLSGCYCHPHAGHHWGGHYGGGHYGGYGNSYGGGGGYCY